MTNFGISYKHLLIFCLIIIAITAQRGGGGGGGGRGGRSSSRSRSSHSSRPRSPPDKKNEQCLQLFKHSNSLYCTYTKLRSSYFESNQTCIKKYARKAKCFYATTSNQYLVNLAIYIIIGCFSYLHFYNKIHNFIEKIMYSHIIKNIQDPFSKMQIQQKKNQIQLGSDEQIILNRFRNKKYTMNGCSFHQDQIPFSGNVSFVQIKKKQQEEGYSIQLQGKDSIDTFKMSGSLQFFGNQCVITAWKQYDRPFRNGQYGIWRKLKYEGYYYHLGFWGLWKYENVDDYRYKGTWHLQIQN